MHFLTFLDAKPLCYDTIDYDRMPRTWQQIRDAVRLPPVIHLIGTNGKGTTGRFLAQALRAAGRKVGHYTSPHILRFNERIWIDGSDATDVQLQTAFERVVTWLDPATADALSYFEFTTLMAVAAFAGCDIIVMEAGLGGEHDATAVFAKRLTVVTLIGADHQSFLGDTVAEIAATKLRAMAADVILAPQPHPEVTPIAETIAALRHSRIHSLQTLLSAGDRTLAETIDLPEHLRQNLQTAMAALRWLEVPFDAESFGAPLFGRLSRIAPNVRLDVGHNVPAAEAIARALQGERVILIYNSYADKNYREILQRLTPIIDEVQLIPLDDPRGEEPTRMAAVLNELGLTHGVFERITPDRNYLVFGSFAVAEAFLRRTGMH